MKVVVIDDEYFTRKDICSLFKEIDETLDVADFESPIPALEYLKLNRVDVIASDIRMPDMDGLDFFEIVSEKYPDVYPIIVSGFGDFEYAQRAIRFGVKAFILKPVDEELFLMEARKALSTVSVKNAGSGQASLSTDRKNAEEWLHEFLFGRSDEPGRVATDLETMWARRVHCLSIVRTDMELTSPFIRAIRESLEAFAAEVTPLVVGGRSRSEVLLLLYREDDQQRQDDLLLSATNKTMREIMSEMRRHFDLHYYIATSGPRTGLKGLEEGLASAEASMKRRFCTNANTILDPNEGGERAAKDRALTNQVMVLIEDLLNKRYWGAANDQLNGVFVKIHEDGPDCAYDILRVCRHCYNVLVKLIWRNDYVLNELGRKARSRLANMDGYFNSVRLKEDTSLLLSAVAEADSVIVHRDHMVDDLIAFLEKNYDLDISFHGLAQTRYRVTVEHLNRKFKKQSGKNLSVYLKELRIEKARELLNDPALAVTDIAGMVGYNDVSHFIQIFKKLRGETPGEYRRKGPRP